MTDKSDQTNATAWIIELDSGLYVAVGELEMVHIVQEPEVFDIPQAPFYCSQVLMWQEGIIPVLDIPAWLEGYALPRKHDMVGIFTYQQQSSASLDFGALPMISIPSRTQVSNNQACDLPTNARGWRELSISCFSYNDRVIPILDLPYVFSGLQRTAKVT